MPPAVQSGEHHRSSLTGSQDVHDRGVLDSRDDLRVGKRALHETACINRVDRGAQDAREVLTE